MPLAALLAAGTVAHAQSNEPTDVSPSLRPAVTAYRAGDLVGAESSLQALAPADSDAAAWLGAILMERGAQREGLRLIQQSADAGSAEGAHRLALVFANGDGGTPRNEARAVELFERAAEKGHKRAQLNLGTLYLRGQGVPRDVIQARAWLEKAAMNGDPYALYALGRAMSESQGPANADPVRAADLYRQAAEKGHPFAALRYGLALSDGSGIKRDPVAAQRWLVHAQTSGVPEAALALGDMAARTPASRDKAANDKILKLAINWFEVAANAGVSSAQFKLANAYIAGAGVAGLAAIGTAASLGAIVRANDTRAEVADQVVSLGGEFVKVDYEEEGSGGGGYAKVMSEGFQQAQREMYAKQAREVDIIITTALIPGKPAPRLITAEMVQSMKPGSVIVDMAAERGGNCELTEPGQAVVKHGVTIIGYTDLNSRLARQSSTLYATNLFRLTEELCKTKDGVINVNMQDDAIRGLTVVKEGSVTWPPPALKPASPAGGGAKAAMPAMPAKKGHGHGGGEPMSGQRLAVMFGVAALLFWFIGAFAPAAFLGHFTVFVLACFVGYMVVWNVTPALHTPLMSVTNAISSIIAIGALVQISPPEVANVVAGAAARPDDWIRWIAVVGIVLTAVNMFGGFAVTQRMLAMFRK